jgi:ribonucleotide reductase alpha subunit
MEDSILTIQQVQFFDKYSRYDHGAQKHETFAASCDRSVDFFADIFKKEMPQGSVFPELREAMLSMDAFPGMRLFQNAGASALRDPESIFNCSYLPVCDLHAFRETMRLLGLGVGVGYSVEQQYVSRLPMISDSRDGGYAKTIVIEDSLYGWTNALYEYMKALFANQTVVVDYSYVRPTGAPLHTRGGFASGPEPLRHCFETIREIVENRRKDRFLRTIDAHDIQCCIASAIVSGGVRRAAMISLFSENDNLMWNAKSGNWYEKHLYRRFANNSVVITGPWQKSQFDRYFDMMVESRSGEPGIFSRYAANITKPARRAYAEFGTNPCVVGDTLVAVADGRQPQPISKLVEEGCDVDVYTVVDGKLAIRKARNFRQTGSAVPVYRVKWSDGTHIDVTANHKFVLKGGQEVEALSLQPSDEVDALTIGGYTKGKEHFETCDIDVAYRQLWYSQMTKSEHRFIVGYHNNCEIVGLNELQVHHIDNNPKNNAINNLLILSSKEHTALHRDRMLGENNPAYTHMSDEWKANLSKACSGELNGNSTGHSNEEIRAAIAKETERLGRVMTRDEWINLAASNGMPKVLNKWRTDGAALRDFLKEVALTTNLPLHERDGCIFVTRVCEVCGTSFEVPYFRRETAVCGRSCAAVRSWQRHGNEMRNGLLDGHERRHQDVRKEQMRVYNDLLAELSRHPTKREWVAECKGRNISPEISRPSSPFTSWDELKEGTSIYNHRVVSVEFVGEEDVYTCTVDDSHTYFGGSLKLTASGHVAFSGVLSRQCGEVALNPWQFCNLSIANVRYTDSADDLKEKVRLAAIWGTMQAAYLTKVNHTAQLRPQWYINQVNERLLGVDLNGLRDNPMLNEMFDRRDGTLLNELKTVVLETNQEYAKLLGIAPAAAATCDKPAGNSATLFNTASGAGPRYAPYYTRRVRLSSTGRVAKLLALHGMPFNPEVGQELATANTLVFDFPVKAPDGAVYASDLSGVDQLEFWRWCKTEWTEHNPSTTIYFNLDEVSKMSDWSHANQNLLGGVSFLPRDNSVYELSPYEVITPEKYEEDTAKMPYIDWTLLDSIGGDISTSAQEFACVGGACEVV